LSAKQTLIIDRKQQDGYASHVAAGQAKDLQAAISKAIDRLNQSEQKINSVRYSNPKEPLNAQQKLDADDARQTLNDAAGSSMNRQAGRADAVCRRRPQSGRHRRASDDQGCRRGRAGAA